MNLYNLFQKQIPWHKLLNFSYSTMAPTKRQPTLERNKRHAELMASLKKGVEFMLNFLFWINNIQIRGNIWVIPRVLLLLGEMLFVFGGCQRRYVYLFYKKLFYCSINKHASQITFQCKIFFNGMCCRIWLNLTSREHISARIGDKKVFSIQELISGTPSVYYFFLHTLI